MRKITVVILTVAMLLASICPCISVYADTGAELEEIIEGIIKWKKSELGASEGDSIFTPSMLSLAGTTAGDWYPIGIGRYGYEENYTAYLAVLSEYVSGKYTEKGKLSAAKATEWHRISLAVTAAKGDPRAFGVFNGAPIDLIADGTYNRGLTASPGRQGINGWIWGLIALDSMRYTVPEGAYSERDDFITEILKLQLSDGGFALIGDKADPDITAMAVQALSPYYNSEKVFEFTSKRIKGDDGKFITVQTTVRQAADKCLSRLSELQGEEGHYSSWGMTNLESTCQVTVALCALGIDPLSDDRFIKNGNTLLDGILKFHMEDGGFAHSFVYDENNPEAIPGEANSMASEQALYALVALWRYKNGMRALYDMRDEFSEEESAALRSCNAAISALGEASGKTEIGSALALYQAIPEADRCYVNGFWKLRELADTVGYEMPPSIPQDTPSEMPSQDKNDDETDDAPILFFSEAHKARANALPPVESLTTEYYTEVAELRYVLSSCEDFEGKDGYIILLDKAHSRISELQKEIESLKADIKERLYPFDKIGLKDKDAVNSLYSRYEALSEYDRSLLEPSDREGLEKSKTLVDDLELAVRISAISLGAAALLTFVVILSIRKRRREKALNRMQESDE